MKISLIVHSASPDMFLQDRGITSYFAALLTDLTRQTISDFELIYVDTYHTEQREWFAEVLAAIEPKFRVKHVPVHHEHRYWYDRGYCYISAAKNTGILYADGELCVSCDDAEFFPPGFLDRYWQYHKRGRYMHALHKRFRTVETDAGLPVYPLSGDAYVNDHRWQYVAKGVFRHRHGSMCYAGTSFSLGDALTLNGYNERMDGCKSLEDGDFGNRLQMLGRSFALDPEGYLYILDHRGYAADIDCNWVGAEGEGQETKLVPIQLKVISNLIAVENHGMVRCGLELLDIVANKDPLTSQQLGIIREETLKYRKFDPLAPEHAERMAIWMGTPTFNLVEQRAALRRSPDWEWS